LIDLKKYFKSINFILNQACKSANSNFLSQFNWGYITNDIFTNGRFYIFYIRLKFI